jgi:hypothetical protein
MVFITYRMVFIEGGTEMKWKAPMVFFTELGSVGPMKVLKG